MFRHFLEHLPRSLFSRWTQPLGPLASARAKHVENKHTFLLHFVSLLGYSCLFSPLIKDSHSGRGVGRKDGEKKKKNPSRDRQILKIDCVAKR